MYLEELLPEFRKGAKIRRKNWNKEDFIRDELGVCWDNCRPVRREEVTFYEEKEDE